MDNKTRLYTTCSVCNRRLPKRLFDEKLRCKQCTVDMALKYKKTKKKTAELTELDRIAVFCERMKLTYAEFQILTVAELDRLIEEKGGVV